MSEVIYELTGVYHSPKETSERLKFLEYCAIVHRLEIVNQGVQ